MSRLRKPRNQSFYVSIAGPITNIILSGLALLITQFMLSHRINVAVIGGFVVPGNLFLFFVSLGLVNISLAVINLLPIPPLDGSVLIERLIPKKHLGAYFNLRARMLPFAMLILLAFLYLGGFRSVIGSLDNWWINHLLS
jgi:Zn-dependent protease